MCEINAFSNDFQGFAECMPLNGLFPAEGQFAVARDAKSLLFQQFCMMHTSSRGGFSSDKLVFLLTDV